MLAFFDVIIVTLDFARRNLGRNKRRTMLVASSVGLGVWLAVIFFGTRLATYERLIKAGATGGYGLLTVTPTGHDDLKTSSRRLALGPVIERLNRVEGLGLALPRLHAAAMAATAVASAGVALVGMDLELEDISHNLLLASMTQGKPPGPGDPSGCVVGELLMKHLGARLGDRLVYTVTSSSGQIESRPAFVRGVFATGNPEHDAHLVILARSTLSEALGVDGNSASFVAIFPALGTDAESLRSSLRAGMQGFDVEVRTWRETLADLNQYIRIDQAMARVFLVFTSVIIAAGVLTTIVLALIERRRELGIMLALGMTPVRLFLMTLTEAAVSAVLGVALGALTVAPLYVYLKFIGIDLSRFIGGKLEAGGVAADLIIGCTLGWRDGLTIAGTLIFLSVVGSIYPAARAAWAVPLRALRGES